MALDSHHPLYDHFYPQWLKLRHSYEGEDTIKDQETDYLPPTAGQLMDWNIPVAGGFKGQKAYENYKSRAVFPEFIGEAVKAMIGVMHSNPPVIELPQVMMPLMEQATNNRESLPLLLRRINEAQLVTGRIGLMGDLPDTEIVGSILPYIATYDAEKITNWDDGKREMPTIQELNLVVLDESEYERQADFTWEMIEKYRVLVLGDVFENESLGIYQQALFVGSTDFNPGQLMTPMLRGQSLTRIPFVFINATDLLSDPLPPPLRAIANLSLAIYRGEADYRIGLHNQSQDTLVVKGRRSMDDKGNPIPLRYGLGAVIDVPPDGDAKFIGLTSDGLPEQRECLMNDRKQAREMAAQLLDTTSRAKESGEALRVRVAAQTATLNQISLTGAEGLQTILRKIAEWIGADPEQVNVIPNLDFADSGMTPHDFFEMMAAKEKGLLLSDESIHALLKKHGYTEKEFEDEDAAVQMEREAQREKTESQMEAFARGVMQ